MKPNNNNLEVANRGNDEDDDDDEDELNTSSHSYASTESHTTDPKSSNNKKSRKDSSNDDEVKFVQRETQQVYRLRWLVFAVLLAAAAAVSVVVYKITSSAEREEFETQYKGAAKQIQNAFLAMVDQKLGAISALAVATIAHGVDHRRTWPFVAVSSFQQRCTTAQALADTLFVGIAPYVAGTDQELWNEFVMTDAKWFADGYEYQEKLGLNAYLDPAFPGDDPDKFVNATGTVTARPIFYYNDAVDDTIVLDDSYGPFLPIWQTSPIVRQNMINQNLFRNPLFANDATRTIRTRSVVLSNMTFAPPGDSTASHRLTSLFATIQSVAAQKQVSYLGDPMSVVMMPVFNNFDEDNRFVVAILFAVFRWANFFDDVLPPNMKGVVLVLENSCTGAFTYEVNGATVVPMGRGDLHDHSFDALERSADFSGFTHVADGTEEGIPLDKTGCHYSIHVYPSDTFQDAYTTQTPLMITFAVALIFVFTAFMFFFYDHLVERRQSLILRKAMQSDAIVSSLFPKVVRDRLLQDREQNNKGGSGAAGAGGPNGNALMAPNHRLKNFLNNGGGGDNDLGLQPIADLFPHTTVLFADIAGFTAWSSTRDPAQVFILLQTVYQAFDTLANRRKVFKVETIGDSYVAVTGLPEPQDNHAVLMARFAGDCMMRMNEITKELEVTLGPDTGDLCMRMGLHSGPVTAGVLRGERSRFQLFGDTVNTAARMESTGIPNKIQISQSTAELLLESGKDHWIKPRKDAVEAKGKGVLNTFWLTPNPRKFDNSSVASSKDHSTSGGGTQSGTEDDEPTSAVQAQQKESLKEQAEVVRQERLVNWIVELLSDHIKHLLARRKTTLHDRRNVVTDTNELIYRLEPGKTSLDEVAEVISLPKFDARAALEAHDYTSIEIDPSVLQQLREYVAIIAKMYRTNPFHNFEHACHVTMAVNKFLKRIVAPDIDVKQFENTKHIGDLASQLHDYTHGINSDPLSLLAIVLSGLIHDADHRGVSNPQLIKEEPEMGKMYRGKSVAEQNSLDISWDLLMTEQFAGLRSCLFANRTEMRRFRQVLVNVVLATDIFDKELNDLRKARWNKAFSKEPGAQLTSEDNDLRATIVIEHIIQASDVAHTMQHWHIYRKWNERLFREMYRAFKAGRMGMDPSTFWYKGELGFFDNYIIPLSKKLKDCNVFGVSSDECLNYALKNRIEWEERGQEIVESMMDALLKEDSET